jgi:subtilisin family serine protease
VPQIGLVTVRPRPGLSLAATLRALRSDPRVRRVEPEGRMTLREQPDDPALRTDDPAVPGTPLQWWAEREGFYRAWDAARGTGARVAVIDTGAEGTHPDLAGKIAEAVDLDAGRPGAADTDSDGHGTHVASLACAASGNGVGLAGAGRDCRLIVIRSDLTDASIAAGIVRAADLGAHALNMSFGDAGDARSSAIADAIAYAYRKGVVMVAAAADEPVTEQGEPANLLQPTDSAARLELGAGLVVTAADSSDQRAAFAGRGSQISLAAYGALRTGSGTRGLFSAYPAATTAREQPSVGIPPDLGCNCRFSLDSDSRYALLAGTSMSAPQVAGLAAMLRVLNPDLSVLEVLRILKQTARRAAGTSWEPELGWGIIDAGTAVEAARGVDRRPPVSRVSGPSRVRGRRVTVRLRGRDPAPAGLVASGVARYEVYARRNTGRLRRVARTSRTVVRLRVAPGRYRYHSRAVDRAGNREGAPKRPDVSLRVVG